jgi:hypothetical protein
VRAVGGSHRVCRCKCKKDKKALYHDPAGEDRDHDIPLGGSPCVDKDIAPLKCDGYTDDTPRQRVQGVLVECDDVYTADKWGTK